jgi:CBS domain-containing protein
MTVVPGRTGRSAVSAAAVAADTRTVRHALAPAEKEVAQMPVQSPELRVGNLMTIDPITIDPEAMAMEAERLLKTYRVSGLPVVEAGELRGVISQSDLMVAHSSEMIGANWDRLRVRHLMSSPAVTVHADATITAAARELLARHIHRLVVVDDDGAPIGVVTPLDLLRSLLEDPDPDLS